MTGFKLFHCKTSNKKQTKVEPCIKWQACFKISSFSCSVINKAVGKRRAVKASVVDPGL